MPHTRKFDTDSLVEFECTLSRLGGDRSLFDDFVAIFREDSPILMREISAGLESEDGHIVERKAHALKGLTSNFGAKPCVEHLLEIEQAAKRNELSEAREHFRQLLPLFEKLAAELETFVS